MNCKHCSEVLYGSCWVQGGDVVHQQCLNAWHNANQGRYFKCPVCKTTGQVDDESRPHYENVPNDYMCGPYDPPTMRVQRGFEKKTCSLCSGHGYLAKEAKPITAVVGYTV